MMGSSNTGRVRKAKGSGELASYHTEEKMLVCKKLKNSKLNSSKYLI